MKKSFLKRVMAAAVAVPVALTQTVMFTSGAEEASSDAAASTVLNVDAFLAIDAEGSTKEDWNSYKAAQSLLESETDLAKKYAFVQESDWNTKLATALNSMYDAELTLDKQKLADSINVDKWYADIAKGALLDENTQVTAHIYTSEVVVTISVDYNYGEALAEAVKQKVPSEYEGQQIELDIDTTGSITGVIELTADTSALVTDKQISFEVTKNTIFTTADGELPVDAAVAYVQGLINDAKADIDAAVQKEITAKKADVAAYRTEVGEKQATLKNLEATGASSAEIDQAKADLAKADADLLDAEQKLDDAEKLAGGKIDDLFATYQSKFDKAVSYIDKFEGRRESTITGANADDVLSQFHDLAAARNKWGDKLPQSLNGIKNYKYYPKASEVFDSIITQINNVATANGVVVEVTLDDLFNVAADATDITVHGVVEDYAAQGDACALLSDSLTDAETTYYTTYFNELLKADGYEVDELVSKKAIEVEGSADSKTLTGEGYLNVYRIVWFTVKEIETTTTTEETTTTTEETTTTTEETTTTTEETTTTTEETTTTTEDPDGTTTEETTTTEDPDATTTTEETTTTEDPDGTTTTTENTEETTTTTTEDGNPRYDVQVEVKVDQTFHFSHDSRAFDVNALLNVDGATIFDTDEDGNTITDEDGNPVTKPVDASLFSFALDKDGSVEGLSPEAVYAKRVEGAAYVATTLYVYYEDQLVKMDKYPEVYIGVKGDANLDGTVDASDAAAVLVYAAEKGAGNNASIYSPDNKTLDKLAYLLADADGESMDGGQTDASGNADSPLDSSDAASILVYSAAKGSDPKADWIPDVFDEDEAPAITKAIYEAEKAND